MDQQILREYLVALGFRIDEHGARGFDDRLRNLDKKALALGKGLVGVAAAAVTLSTVFARSMERLYYSARYADSSVEKLQEMEFAFRNVGLEGGAATAMLKRMAEAVRGNPGLGALLEKITGKPIRGRDMSDVMLDFVNATKQMPFYQAQRVASLFGISAEDLFNLQQGADKLDELRAKRKAMADEMGLDADHAAEVGREYMNLWRDVTERAKMFAFVVGEAALPQVQELVKETDKLLVKWSSIVRDIKEYGAADFMKRLREGIGGAAEGERVTLSKESKERLGLPEGDKQPTLHVPGEAVPGTPGWATKKAQETIDRWMTWRNRRGEQQRTGGKPRPAGDLKSVDAATDLSDFKGRPAEPVDPATFTTGAGGSRPGGTGSLPGAGAAAVAGAPAPVVNVTVPHPGRDSRPPVPEGAAQGPRRPQEPPARLTAPPAPVRPPAAPERDADGTVWSPPQESFDPQEYMAALEKHYQLPRGLLDRVWDLESSRGEPGKMLSPKNAKGHFGFVPKTAEAYGVRGKEDDFKASAEASAHMWSDLLRQYHGDVRQAAAAYNWGSGKLERFGLGAAPRETRQYMDAVAGAVQPGGAGGSPVNVTQNTTVNVSGVSDPSRAADSVVRRQRELQGDLVRNLGPKVR